MLPRMDRSPHLALCRALTPEPSGAPPEWLLLVPPGAFAGRDGRAYVNADPHAIVAAFDPAAALPLDWEHATHLRAPQGQDAPAAGWILALEARADGAVWGRVEWTASGAEAVTSRGYRYYSPAYYLGPDGRAVIGLASAGLTNQPNLRLPALNRPDPLDLDPQPEDLPLMLPREITAPLGLPEDATAAQAATAIATLTASLNQAQHQAQTPDLGRFVPRAELDAALNRARDAETALTEIQTARTQAEIESLIERGLNSRRLTPATVDYHRAQARTEGGLERLRAYLDVAPAVLGETPLPHAPPPDAPPSLNADEQRIAAAFGHTADTLARFGGRPV